MLYVYITADPYLYAETTCMAVLLNGTRPEQWDHLFQHLSVLAVTEEGCCLRVREFPIVASNLSRRHLLHLFDHRVDDSNLRYGSTLTSSPTADTPYSTDSCLPHGWDILYPIGRWRRGITRGMNRRVSYRRRVFTAALSERCTSKRTDGSP